MAGALLGSVSVESLQVSLDTILYFMYFSVPKMVKFHFMGNSSRLAEEKPTAASLRCPA